MCSVHWHHIKDKKSNKVIGTKCVIVEHLYKNEDKPISSVTTRLHPNDNFCKSTGRKVSLTKALEQLPRSTRILFWNEYNKRWRSGNGTKSN